MGRGASDLTASALAKALEADACEIYTDVTGVFSADPRIVPRARKLARVSFDEMLEMAGAGSKVLALRSVEFARNHGVVAARALGVHVGAGHVGHRRARTTTRGSERWKTRSSRASSPTRSESKVTVLGVPDRPGISASCSSRWPAPTSTST